MKSAYCALWAAIAGSLALLSHLNTCPWWAVLIVLALIATLLSVQRDLTLAVFGDRVEAMKVKSLNLHYMQLRGLMDRDIRIAELEAKLGALQAREQETA
jgi:hypothetical protein